MTTNNNKLSKQKEIIINRLEVEDELILDDADIQRILKISRRTSLEYRDKGYIRYHRFAEDSKIFYLYDELLEDIRRA